jgi:hypothetical protein
MGCLCRTLRKESPGFSLPGLKLCSSLGDRLRDHSPRRSHCIPKHKSPPSVVQKMLVVVQKNLSQYQRSLRLSGSCLRIFVSVIASKTRKLTSAAALPLSTASLNLKVSLSRSYSTAATKRLLSRLTAFAKSYGGSHECRLCDLPDAPLGGIGRPVLASNRQSFLFPDRRVAPRQAWRDGRSPWQCAA